MSHTDAESPERVATWSELPDREPEHAVAAGVDLVVVRDGEDVSVRYGRCLHRGVLLGDGRVEGENLICGVHGWDYRYDTGVSEYDNSERLEAFTAGSTRSATASPSPTPPCRPSAVSACGRVTRTTAPSASRLNKRASERLVVESAADGLQNFFEASVKLVKVMARACGHDSLSGVEPDDLTAWKREIAEQTGVEYAGVGS